MKSVSGNHIYWKILVFILQLKVCHTESNGEVRLAGGSSSRNGKVEFYYEYQWGSITVHDFGESEARVICHQLGFDGPGTIYTWLNSTQANFPVWTISCTGNEERVLDCKFNQTEASAISPPSVSYSVTEYWDHDSDTNLTCITPIAQPLQADTDVLHTDDMSMLITIDVITFLVAIALIILCTCLVYYIIKRNKPVKPLKRTDKDVEPTAMQAEYSRVVVKSSPETKRTENIPVEYIEMEADTGTERNDTVPEEIGRGKELAEYSRVVVESSPETKRTENIPVEYIEMEADTGTERNDTVPEEIKVYEQVKERQYESLN